MDFQPMVLISSILILRHGIYSRGVWFVMVVVVACVYDIKEHINAGSN